MVDMSGKVALVTGGNGGIGYVSCQKMLEKNAKVYVAARDSEKSREAIKKLKEETGKDAFLIPLDLSDLHQVRKAAEDFLSKKSRLDVLINNAGIMAAPIEELTKDGYDLQFGVNVLGHFHLTSLLMPAILASPSPRIVNVTSKGHQWPMPEGVDFKKVKGPKTATKVPGGQLMQRYQYYGQSKLGNILHANELARRYADNGLVAISVHPGFVKTDLQRSFSTGANLFTNITARMAHGGKVFNTTEGAVTQLYAANAPEAKGLSGKYIEPITKVVAPHKNALDQNLAQKMWDWCENELKAY